MSTKDPILPNNFETESNPPENDAESAPLTAEIAPNDTQNGPQSAPSDGGEAVVGASGARPAAPGRADVGAHSDAPKSRRGPKTPAGKLALERSEGKTVSRNAVKHGLRSPHPYLIEELESVEEWEEFKLGIIAGGHIGPLLQPADR